MKPPRILIIAGSDSGGGAGLQADIKTVTMLGGHAMTAITAITAQNTLGVEAVLPVPAEMVLKQIDVVMDDIGADAIKIGMIGSPAVAAVVADRLQDLSLPILFDPVMVATSGARLADAETIAVFGRLAALACLVTPNAPELAELTNRCVETLSQLEEAGIALAAESGTPVLAKGGHLGGGEVVDLLAHPDGRVQTWHASRIETRHDHGTGCTLASAIACGLGRGLALSQSIERARTYVAAAMRAAPKFGGGNGPMGHALGLVPFELVHSKVETGERRPLETPGHGF